MELRYSRNIPAITEQECALLREKRAAVIGCGGLGGYLVEFLARIGIGFIRAVDGDVFEETNLNRQLLAETAVLGRNKAETAAARVRRVNPEVTVEAVSAFLNKDNAAELLSGCHVVLDALDSVPARKILAAACAEAGIPYIYGAISGWIAQAGISLPGDGMIGRLYPDDVQVRDQGVLSFTPALCASMQTALCLKYLTGRPVETGKLYYADLLNQEFESLSLSGA